MTQVSIDWCLQDELPQLQRLIHEHWRPNHVMTRDEQLFRWQYRFPGRPELLSVLVARDGEQIVGFLGLIQADFCDFGRRFPGAWLAMWFAKPDSVGVGLELMRQALRGQFSFVGCIGINDTALSLYRLLRFEVFESLPRFVRVISGSALDRLLEVCESDYASAARNEWLKTDSNPRPQRIGPGDKPLRFQVRRWNNDCAGRWDESWNERFGRNLRSTWRDASHLEWRFVKHPRFTYQVECAEETVTGRFDGLTVYRVEKVESVPVNILRIVELIGTPDARLALVESAVAAGHDADAAFADFHCTAQSVGDDIAGLGFRAERAGQANLPSLFQPLDAGRAAVRGAFWRDPSAIEVPFHVDSGFYVTRADGDQDRPN